MLFTDVLTGGEGVTALATTITLTSDTTLTQHYDFIKLNSSNDIEIKLPDDTSPFLNKGPMNISRIDNFVNINNIAKITGETPSNLNESGQEILLDIELSVDIIFCQETSKYQSTNGFSEIRLQDLQNRSSSLTIAGYDKDNYIAVDTTSQAHDTAKTLQPAEGWIIDRTTNDFNPDVFKVSYPATSGIDTTTPNEDGNFIIYGNKTGGIIMESISARSLLPVFSTSGANANNSIQLGQCARSGGTVTSIAAAIQGLVNTPMVLNNLLQAFGTLNSAANPLGLEANGVNINLNFTAGEGIGALLGWTVEPGGLAPNLNILSADVPQVTIILTGRNDAILGAGITANVTQIEDPNNPGTLLTMGNNTSKVNFYRGFPDIPFITESLGQQTSGTIAIAIAKKEKPFFPSLVNFGFSLSEIFLNKSETDFSIGSGNVAFQVLPRVDLA